jgi:FtsZ-binding cell division protein ZapB
MNKKNLVLIAGASMLALGVPAVSMAQGNGAASGPFADVPADHWAYQAVDTLQKAGIVIGYPDGTYGGKRAMTRYEFAVAIARLLPLINNQGASNYATKDDLAALRQDLEKKLQENSDAIDALRKLVDEFQPELQKLGQDVAAVNDRLNALEARVAAVEEEQRRVKFNGALNLIAKAEDVTKGATWVDKNGINNIGDKHLLKNADFYNDFLLGIRGKVSDTATANVKLDFGNYLSSLGNTEAMGGGAPGFGNIYSPGYNGTPSIATGGLTAQNQQTTVWEANLEAPVSLGVAGGAEATIGRFGQQWTRYTLMQADSDVYTNLYQTDSGNIITDGGKLNFNLGGARIAAYAGQMKAIPFAQPAIGSVSTGAGQFLPQGLIAADAAAGLTQGAGIRATFGNPNNWVLGASVQTLGLGGVTVDPNTTKPYGGMSVYGLDFNGALPLIGKTGLTVDANWTVSAEATKPYNFNDVGNGWRYQSTDDQLGYSFGALSLKGGYQYVGPNFTAPGYWGKVGSWTNPTNVEGGVISAKYAFNPKLSLNADYEGYKAAYGANRNGTPISSPLRQGDRLNHYQVGVAFGLTSSYDVDLGYEQSQYDLKNNGGTLLAAGKPTQSFINIGIGHNLNANTSVKLLYQIGQYRDKGTHFDGGAGDNDGNVAVGQFSCKF